MFHSELLANVLNHKKSINSLDEIYIWGAYGKSSEIINSIRKIGGINVNGYIDR